MNDTQVILMALQKERDELHEKIMQVDRIMSRIEGIGYTHDDIKQPVILMGELTYIGRILGRLRDEWFYSFLTYPENS